MFYVIFNELLGGRVTSPPIEFESRTEALEYALQESRRTWGDDKVEADDTGEIVVHLGSNDWCARIEEAHEGYRSHGT